MREEHLPRVEAARVVALLLGPRAEERDLKPERSVQPARDVPPLGAEFGMRAVVAREFERARLYDRVLNLLGARGERQERAHEEQPPPHQSSRTARTGPIPMASRPERMAVTTASTRRMATRAVKRTNGGWSSMLQLNDCRFTT